MVVEKEKEYKEAVARMEEIYEVKKGHKDYREMILLAFLINQYEEKH
jgi:hypothetical protein